MGAPRDDLQISDAMRWASVAAGYEHRPTRNAASGGTTRPRFCSVSPVRAVSATIILAFLLPFQAHAESRIDYSSSSFIEIHEPDEDHRGARAAVTHHNEMVHGPGDNGTFSLSLPDGFTVDIIYQWNANGQSERFTVIPPPGYIAQPPEMDVCEGCTETVYVYGATS